MTEEQARELAAQIKEQSPHVTTLVVQSTDMRNAPQNWFVAVKRTEDALAEGMALHIHNWLEWHDATLALFVLRT